MRFDEDYNLIIDTTEGTDYDGRIVISYSGDCAKLQDNIEIPISFIVCGGETLTVKDSKATRFEFSVGEKQPDIKLIESQLTSFFDNSNPNCAIKGFKLVANKKGEALSNQLTQQVEFDSENDEIKIKNNYNKARNEKFFIQAESSGGKFAYKKLRLVVQDNKAPYFKGVKGLRLPEVKITYDPTDDSDTKQTVKIPRAIDDEDDKIDFAWTNVDHDWIQKVVVRNNKYTVTIDKTKIKPTDAGSINIGVTLKDDKYSITRLQNNYLMKVTINYVTPKVAETTTDAVSSSSAAANSTATATTATAATAAGNDTATAANDTATATTDSATTDDSTADNSTDTADSSDSAAADNSTDTAAADNSTDSADDTADSTDSASADSASGDATASTDSTDGTASTEPAKPKEKEVKSGGQLAGLVIKPDSAGSANAEPEPPKPPPVVIPPEDKPVKEQVLQSLQDTAGPVKETVPALPNPESTAAPAK